MASKKIEFDRVRFGVPAYQAAVGAMQSVSGSGLEPKYTGLVVKTSQAIWTLDTVHEFYAKLREEHVNSTFQVDCGGIRLRVNRWNALHHSEVEVTHEQVAVIEQVMGVFESLAPTSAYPPPKDEPPFVPTIFIGHGGASGEWRELEQYLRNHLKYQTQAYEIEPRSGDDIRTILDEMFSLADFAFLVMTAEDQQADGTLRARQNVVHETGLAQGRLGWKRAVVLLENGSEDYSNLGGIQQIRFDKGSISASFGPVAATIKHEFGV